MARIHTPPNSTNEYYGMIDQIYTHLQEIGNMDQEQGVIVTLDGGYFAIGKHLLSLGSYSRDMTDLNVLFNRVIVDKAQKFVYAHNHPNGVAVFSEPDIKSTIAMLMMASVLQIELVDHVLFAYKRKPVSMRKQFTKLWETDWLAYFSEKTEKFVPKQSKLGSHTY